MTIGRLLQSILRWPLLALCLTFAPLIIWTAFYREAYMRYWVAIVFPMIALVALSLWYLVFGWGKFRNRARHFAWLAGAGLLLGIGFLALFRYDGSVGGSSVPKFVVRWAPEDIDRSSVSSTELESIDSTPKDLEAETADGVIDSPELYGPGKDGMWGPEEVNADFDWENHPPKLLWRKPMGLGWSGFAVVGRRAITLEQLGDNESVSCLDLLSGELLWRHLDPARYYLAAETGAREMAGDGPRSVPTVHGQKVFTYGATGILNCLELDTSKQIWKRDLREDPGIKFPEWGHSCSPLVIEDLNLVVVAASLTGQETLLAVSAETGDTVWAAGGTGASYSSPRLITFHGERQVVSVNAEDVSGYDPATGELRWRFPWKGVFPKVAQPIEVEGNRLLITASYGAGSYLLQIGKNGEEWSADEVWKTLKLKTKFSSAQVRDGFAYGLNEGTLTCVSLEDGSRVWRDGKYGFGQNLLLDDRLLIQAEDGYLVVVEASPDQFRETARIEALSSMTWNPPTYAGQYLLVRNDKEAMCFQLAPKP